MSKLTVCVIELQDVILQSALYSINDDINWVLTRDSCIDVLKLIFPNYDQCNTGAVGPASPRSSKCR